jgi:hypothetical protein
MHRREGLAAVDPGDAEHPEAYLLEDDGGAHRRAGRSRESQLVGLISPFIISTNCVTIARPSPVPPWSRVVEPSACVKALKMSFVFSGGMPIPVSDTRNRNTASFPV